MANTIAIHWAATTHGTWLHGDPRGSWRNGQLIGPDPYLEAAERASLVADGVVLTEREQNLVANEFGSIVREQHHRIFAATIQPTHIHLVFGPLQEDLKTVIARLKRRSAAAVLAHRREMAALHSRPILGGSNPSIPRSLWTNGKFPIFIFDEYHLMNAIEYVRDHNRRNNLPPDPFDWIEPLYPASGFIGERANRHETSAEPRL
jgi:REP element-mobilizing transposase RayT